MNKFFPLLVILIVPHLVSSQISFTYDNNGNRTSKKYQSPRPTAAIISGNGNLLVSSVPTGNQWYRNDTLIVTATIPNLDYDRKATYSVKVIGINGCLSDKSNEIVTGHFVFTGDGDWTSISNWELNLTPKLLLPGGVEVIINPAADGECIYHGLLQLPPGTIFTVMPDKKFRLIGP